MARGRARLIASYGDQRLIDTTQLAHRIASLAAEKLATSMWLSRIAGAAFIAIGGALIAGAVVAHWPHPA